MSLGICIFNKFPGGVDAEEGQPKGSSPELLLPLNKEGIPAGTTRQGSSVGCMVNRKVSDVTFWVQGRAVQSHFLFPRATSPI